MLILDQGGSRVCTNLRARFRLEDKYDDCLSDLRRLGPYRIRFVKW